MNVFLCRSDGEWSFGEWSFWTPTTHILLGIFALCKRRFDNLKVSRRTFTFITRRCPTKERYYHRTSFPVALWATWKWIKHSRHNLRKDNQLALMVNMRTINSCEAFARTVGYFPDKNSLAERVARALSQIPTCEMNKIRRKISQGDPFTVYHAFSHFSSFVFCVAFQGRKRKYPQKKTPWLFLDNVNMLSTDELHDWVRFGKHVKDYNLLHLVIIISSQETLSLALRASYLRARGLRRRHKRRNGGGLPSSRRRSSYGRERDMSRGRLIWRAL